MRKLTALLSHGRRILMQISEILLIFISDETVSEDGNNFLISLFFNIIQFSFEKNERIKLKSFFQMFINLLISVQSFQEQFTFQM